MKPLSGRLLDIALGEVDLPVEVVLKYRKKLVQAGYDISCAPLPEGFSESAKEEGNGNRRPLTHSVRPSATNVTRNHWSSAFLPSCRWLGEVLTYEPCRCGSSRKIAVHACRNKYKLCVLTERERRLLQDPDWKIQSCQTCDLRESTPRFLTTADLTNDIKRLIANLPSEITAVAGIARSGLLTASLISMFLHVPLFFVRQAQGDVIEAGNGWRMNEGTPTSEGTTLIVDDTVMTGNSLRAVSPLVKNRFSHPVFAAVYVNPLSNLKPDVWAVDLPWPHLLEWNLFNSVLTPMTAVDFDGILCHDCPPRDDDDGPRYLQFLKQAKPLYLTRKTALPLIVTARLEKYRHETVAWLEKWGVRYEKLVMGPWADKQERARADVAAFKAEHFRRFLQTHPRRVPKPHLFVESDPHQARRIAQLSGGLVACPAAGRCFP